MILVGRASPHKKQLISVKPGKEGPVVYEYVCKKSAVFYAIPNSSHDFPKEHFFSILSIKCFEKCQTNKDLIVEEHKLLDRREIIFCEGKNRGERVTVMNKLIHINSTGRRRKNETEHHW